MASGNEDIDEGDERKTISDEVIDLSPPGVERNARYADTDFYRCKFIHTEEWPHYFFDCHFKECHSELRKAGRSHCSHDCKFENCVFVFIKAYQFMFYKGQEFRSCTFKGTLKDSVFVLDPNGEYSKGVVLDCNFEDLKFDHLEFRGHGSSSGLSFPDWPIIRLYKGGAVKKSHIKEHYPIEFFHENCGYSSRDQGFVVIDLTTKLKNPEDLWTVGFDAPSLEFNHKSKKALPEKSLTEKMRAINKSYYHSREKYSEVFVNLQRRASILSITRHKKDVILSIMIKDSDEVERFMELTLIDCSKAEFIGSENDGEAGGYEKKFFITGMDISVETDTVLLKGPRKKMGHLHLTFDKAAVKGDDGKSWPLPIPFVLDPL